MVRLRFLGRMKDEVLASDQRPTRPLPELTVFACLYLLVGAASLVGALSGLMPYPDPPDWRFHLFLAILGVANLFLATGILRQWTWVYWLALLAHGLFMIVAAALLVRHFARWQPLENRLMISNGVVHASMFCYWLSARVRHYYSSLKLATVDADTPGPWLTLRGAVLVSLFLLAGLVFLLVVFVFQPEM